MASEDAESDKTFLELSLGYLETLEEQSFFLYGLAALPKSFLPGILRKFF